MNLHVVAAVLALSSVVLAWAGWLMKDRDLSRDGYLLATVALALVLGTVPA
jgi:hypothetical protein